MSGSIDLTIGTICAEVHRPLDGRILMYTLAQATYLDSAFGVEQELPHAGSSLENPFVFDASARELKDMASQGLVEIVEERAQWRGNELLIDRLRFKRLREQKRRVYKQSPSIA